MSENQLLIRPERPDDREAIHLLQRAAFGREPEAVLVDRIRESHEFIPSLSLVAELNGEIVGHCMISRAGLDESAPVTSQSELVLCLAPVGVHPDHQREGIGSALVRAAIEAAGLLGPAVITVEGDPRYYMRFGFEPASLVGLRSAHPLPDPAFMALQAGGRTGPLSGRLRLPASFDVVIGDMPP